MRDADGSSRKKNNAQYAFNNMKTCIGIGQNLTPNKAL